MGERRVQMSSRDPRYWFGESLKKTAPGKEFWRDIEFSRTLGYHFSAWRPLPKAETNRRLKVARVCVPNFLKKDRHADCDETYVDVMARVAVPIVRALMNGTSAVPTRLFAAPAKYLFFLNPDRYRPWDSVVKPFYKALGFDLRKQADADLWTKEYLRMIAFLHQRAGAWKKIINDPAAQDADHRGLPEGRRFDGVVYKACRRAKKGSPEKRDELLALFRRAGDKR